jgi:hypothetical protein
MESLFHGRTKAYRSFRACVESGMGVWLNSFRESLDLQGQWDNAPGRDIGVTLLGRITGGFVDVFPHSIEDYDTWKAALDQEFLVTDAFQESLFFEYKPPEVRAAYGLLQLQSAEVPGLPPPARRSPRIASRRGQYAQ